MAKNLKNMGKDQNLKNMSEDQNIKNMSEDQNIKNTSEDQNIKNTMALEFNFLSAGESYRNLQVYRWSATTTEGVKEFFQGAAPEEGVYHIYNGIMEFESLSPMGITKVLDVILLEDATVSVGKKNEQGQTQISVFSQKHEFRTNDKASIPLKQLTDELAECIRQLNGEKGLLPAAHEKFLNSPLLRTPNELKARIDFLNPCIACFSIFDQKFKEFQEREFSV